MKNYIILLGIATVGVFNLLYDTIEALLQNFK